MNKARRDTIRMLQLNALSARGEVISGKEAYNLVQDLEAQKGKIKGKRTKLPYKIRSRGNNGTEAK